MGKKDNEDKVLIEYKERIDNEEGIKYKEELVQDYLIELNYD